MASPSQSWVTAQGHQTLTDRWWGPRAGRRVSRRCHQADVRGERVSELGELTALSDTRSLLDGLRASWRVHLRRPPVTPRGQLSLVMGLPPGGWRLGCPGQEHLTAWVFAKGITLQMVRTPPFILPLFMEWEQRFVLLMNNIF